MSDLLAEICGYSGEFIPRVALRRGDVFGGRYELLEQVGRGGSAVVWQARDRILARDVAIKVAQPRDEKTRQRLVREAQIGAQLGHPSLMPVLDFGGKNGCVYIIMPLVAGPTLRARVNGGRLPWRTVAVWIHHLLAGLGLLHAAGYIHRDVKSENCLISTDASGDRLILADFGLARTIDPCGTSEVIGSINYMAPERVTDVDVDERSDLYSVGVVLFEALTRIGREKGIPQLSTTFSSPSRAELSTSTAPCGSHARDVVSRFAEGTAAAVEGGEVGAVTEQDVERVKVSVDAPCPAYTHLCFSPTPAPTDAQDLDPLEALRRCDGVIHRVAVGQSKNPFAAPDRVADGPLPVALATAVTVDLSQVGGEGTGTCEVLFPSNFRPLKLTQVVGVEFAFDKIGDQPCLTAAHRYELAIVGERSDITRLDVTRHPWESVEILNERAHTVGPAVMAKGIRRHAPEDQLSVFTVDPKIDAQGPTVAIALERFLCGLAEFTQSGQSYVVAEAVT